MVTLDERRSHRYIKAIGEEERVCHAADVLLISQSFWLESRATLSAHAMKLSKISNISPGIKRCNATVKKYAESVRVHVRV